MHAKHVRTWALKHVKHIRTWARKARNLRDSSKTYALLTNDPESLMKTLVFNLQLIMLIWEYQLKKDVLEEECFHTNHEHYNFNMNLAKEIFGKIPLEVFIKIQKQLCFKIYVVKNFTKCRAKHMCQCLFKNKNATLQFTTFLKTRPWRKFFLVTFVKHLGSPF